MFDFLNSADPTISEPGKGYREPAVRVEFSRPVKLAPNSSAIGSRGWGRELVGEKIPFSLTTKLFC